MHLTDKRILITAGPTWVPIDNVRVISNVATGQTGILLADRLQKQGAKVTLILGPTGDCCLNKKIRLVRFKFFEELKNKISKELRSKKYDIVIHSAGVSDYQLSTTYGKKIKSEKKILRLSLVPTPKIIDLVKKINNSIFLVGFKFEPAVKKNILIQRTRRLAKRAHLDLSVANTINKNKYLAYIMNGKKISGPICNKRDLAKRLIKILGTGARLVSHPVQNY